MNRAISAILSIFIFLCMLVATERQAWGYVDPGTGLLALQSVAPVLAAAAWFVRQRIRNLFSRTAPVVPSVAPAPEETTSHIEAA